MFGENLDSRALIEGIDDIDNYVGGDDREMTEEEQEDFFGAGLIGKVAGKLFAPKPAAAAAPVINIEQAPQPSLAEKQEAKEAAQKKESRDKIMMYVGIGAFIVTLVGLFIALRK